MKFLFLLWLAAVWLVGCANSTPIPTIISTSNPKPTANSQLAQALERNLVRQTSRNHFSGVALVARNGEIALHQAYGMADAQNKIPNTTATRFQIASVAKTLTATAIMQLGAQNKINLQSPISTYLPDTPAAWQNITVHQLLSHTSGIPDYFTFDEFAAKKNLTPDEIIRVAKTYPLDAEPGAEFGYSNTGYVLLGKLIEIVSGQSYAEFMRRSIFDPLQMSATGRDGDNTPLARGYAAPDTPADTYPITNALGDGDFLATAADLYKFDRALYDDNFLTRDAREKMFTPVGNNHYAYGWEVQSWNGKRVVSHSGGMPGFAATLMRFPDDDAAIILLSNNETYDTTQAAWDIAALLFP
ncbi:MAG: beta-lactamase family protein [Chloroflexi bacterium]|nr:beta-lactamase family protein [Chloroflexota bacterium]